MVLKPDLLRALEAFKESRYVVGVVVAGDVDRIAVEIAMKANTAEIVK